MAKVKMECFSLVDESWLPVTLAESFPDSSKRGPLPRVSLREAFEHGDRIVDLRCYPHERIALMRLLICIAQRALNGPEDENDWKKCKERLASDAVAYLDKHKDCFNLFGDGPRFLQAKPRSTATIFSTQKFRFIDKDGTTLFDGHVQPGCSLIDAELAVGLITFQSFAARGRVEGAPASLPQGLCREGSALHAFLLGDNLLETIWLNLIPKDQVAENRAVVFGDAAWHSEKNAENSYLYRLAPTARHLWLADDTAYVEGRGGRKFLTFGRDSVRELTAAIRTTRKAGKRVSESEELVSATAGAGVPKAAWRELHALAVLRSARRRGGPAALQHCTTLQATNENSAYRLWCGALIGGGKGRDAAVGDVIESVFRLPTQFFEDADAALEDDPRRHPGPNLTYRKGVGYAEEWAGRLQNAVYTYHAKLADAEGGKKAKNQAALRYWTGLEQQAERVLLHAVALGNYWSAEGDWMGRSPWGHEVRKAAHDAYEFSCPHGTPRQLRAYAAGLAVLRRKDSRKSTPPDQPEDEDSNDGGEE
jgi:CRISPR system Cascade subunit CasA